MTRGKLRAHVGALEAKASARAADRLPFSDLPGFLFAVLSVVSEEAGEDLGAQVCRRFVEEKARRTLRTLEAAPPAALYRAAARPDLWGPA